MKIQIPKVLRAYNIYFEDDGWAGICSEVGLPTLEIKKEDFRGGGMDSGVPIDMGMEIPELTFTMEEHSNKLLSKFGQTAVMGRFSAAKANGRDPVESYNIEFTGSFFNAELGSVSPGEKSPQKGTIVCTKFVLKIAGSEVINIDTLNGIRKVGGVDQLAQIVAACA